MSGNETDLVRKSAEQVQADVLAESRTPEGSARRRRLEAMSDEEVERRAREDPDCPPMTDEELAQMRPAWHRELLAQLDKADDALLAEVLQKVTDRLRERAAAQPRQKGAA